MIKNLLKMLKVHTLATFINNNMLITYTHMLKVSSVRQLWIDLGLQHVLDITGMNRRSWKQSLLVVAGEVVGL